MGMTMSQKILAAHAGLDQVKAGQLIEAELDLVLGNDITSPVAIHEMDKMNRQEVFDKDKIALVMDHFIPNKDIKSAENCKCCRDFACKHEITNYFDVGQMGIERSASGERIGSSRRFGGWRRFSYLYLRSFGGFLHRCGKYGYGCRHGDGQSMV